MLHKLLRGIQAHLRQSSDASKSAQTRLGAVIFIHRCGPLDLEVPYPCLIVDNVLEPCPGVSATLRFQPPGALTPDGLVALN